MIRWLVVAGWICAACDAGGDRACCDDLGAPDAARSDAGGPDAGGPDAGGPDVGGPDAGGPDAALACVDYETSIAPLLRAYCLFCHAPPEPPVGLRVDRYERLMSGDRAGAVVTPCRSAQSLLFLKIATDDPPIGLRMPYGGPPLSPAQVALIGRWIDEGARPACAGEGDPCLDTIPPAFAGLQSAQLEDGGASAELCWRPARDNQTAAGALRYAVFEGLDGVDLFARPRLISAPGAGCVSVADLLPARRYCWVVRAEDWAGNREDNTQTLCLETAPLGPCVEYGARIQPLLDRRCTRCHFGEGPPRGLSLETYRDLMGRDPSVVTPCDVDGSLLYTQLALAEPPQGARMPLGGPPLQAARLQLVARWIREGARPSCVASPGCEPPGGGD